MREGADLPVSQEPRYFRNRQLAILEIASGESSPKFLQYLAKACALGRKRARQRATTETELTRNFRCFGFAMWKQLRDHSFHINANTAAILRAVSKCFIRILP